MPSASAAEQTSATLPQCSDWQGVRTMPTTLGTGILTFRPSGFRGEAANFAGFRMRGGIHPRKNELKRCWTDSRGMRQEGTVLGCALFRA